jgi:RNA polymerase sigma factor (sigma-70 family)
MPHDGPDGACAEDDAWARRISHEIAAGSRDALGELFARRFDRLVALVSARTRRDESFALDCVQDAFLRVAESLPPLVSAAALDAWLAKAALSAAIDRLRSDAGRLRRESRPSSSRDESPVDHEISLADEIASLDAHLDDEQRLLMRLRHAAGMTIRQIARHLGLGEAATESRLRRAIDAARERRTDP